MRTVPYLLIGILLAGCSAHRSAVTVRSVAASQTIPLNETDDAAIWIHPTDPSLSLLLVANELRGLEVHEPNGLLRKHVSDGSRPDNVDLIYDFQLGEARVDLAVASCFSDSDPGVKIWRIDPAKRKPIEITAEAIKVFDEGMPLGLCTYKSRKSGKGYFFVTSDKGGIEQYELMAGANETIEARRVRAFGNGSKTEGCVADDERGVVYFAEEDVGIWRFDAEPDATSGGQLVIRAGESGLVPDVEGLAIFDAGAGNGYLLAVSQGPVGGRSIINVYDRAEGNRFITTLEPTEPATGAIERASGIAVVSARISPQFPAGMLVINDHVTGQPSEDIKIYSWADIAKAAHLTTSPEVSPRISR